MSTALPQAFGPYVLESFIAAGGMAEVFLARHNDGRPAGPVCVKRMLLEMGHNPEYVTMFRDEAALAMRLVHGNIVRVFDCGEIDGRMYMAMEYVDGMDAGTLQRRLKRRSEALGVAHALRIGIDMCAGLFHAHTLTDEQRRPLQLIHRDVSPQNIMVSSRGQVKVTDFGIAKAIGRETHTKTGLIKGKIAYMAPEQALGHYIDQRVDQFAAGVVVWEMVTGQRLYQDKSELLTFEKIIRQPPPKPSTVRPNVPGVVDQVIVRALAKSPDERYADLNAFGNALAEALAQIGGATQADLEQVMGWVVPAPVPVPVPVREVERLPTDNMIALPAPPPPPAIDDRHGAMRSPVAPGRMRVTPPMSAAELEQALEPDDVHPRIAASRPAGLESSVSQPTRSKRVAMLQGPASRGAAIPLLTGALLVGVIAGYVVALNLAQPARSAADCAAPSSSVPAVQLAAAEMQRAAGAWGSGDFAAARRHAEDANLAHGTPAAHMLLGEIAMRGGDRLAALTHFRCVIALDPMGPSATELEKRLAIP